MLKRMRTALNGNQGFTMIELLVVLGVLGILAAVAVPKFSNMTNKADMVKAKTELKTIQTGMEMYFAENNSYPEEMEPTDTDAPRLSDYVDLTSLKETYTFSIVEENTDAYRVEATKTGTNTVYAITNKSITKK